jgi:hypothetical protein
LRISKDKNSTKDLPTKIIIDSNKKIPEKKEDEKQFQSNEIKKEEEQQKKKDRIIHENNLTVIQLLQNDLNKLEEESKLLDEEVINIKEEEKNLIDKIDQIKKDLDEETGNLEQLKDINDDKNRELLHLLHLRHQQIMQNANNLNRNINNENNNSNSGQRRERPGDVLNHFTLGEVMDGIFNIANMNRNSNNNDPPQFPFIFVQRHESNEEGPPMSYQQLQGLPSYNYQGRNSNEKCSICDFDLCFNDLVTRLSKCNHIFHKNCLVNRLSTRRSSKCPNCKVSII